MIPEKTYLHEMALIHACEVHKLIYSIDRNAENLDRVLNTAKLFLMFLETGEDPTLKLPTVNTINL